jgi:transcriptional regulator NrdR family protein
MKPRTDDDRGLQCPKCGGGRFRVIYTRRAPGNKLMRRRECWGCKARFTTWERMIGLALRLNV